LTPALRHAKLSDLYEGTPIKTLLGFLCLMFLAFSMSFARCRRAPGPELIYGAPADGFINTFPVMTIDRTTGGFSDFFNNIAPPPFLCSGGETAAGSKFLYVSVPPGSCLNQVGEIIGYSLDQKTGEPTPIPGSPFMLRASASPKGMVVGPNGDVLYAADASGYIDAFLLNKKTGVPERLKGSPFKAGTTYELVVDPSGKFLYASDYDAPGGVFAFSIHPDGTLTPVPGSPFKVPGPAGSNYQPIGIVDTGKYVYIALSNTNQIAAFSIECMTGALKPVSGSPFPTGNGPVFLAQTGRYLYAVNELDGNISSYSIEEKSGKLAPIPGSPFGTDGFSLTIDNTGKYLYLSGHRGVQGYNIDRETGALTKGDGFHDNDGGLWLTVVELPGQMER
jgi:6-phosphogluconolactonase (cycloisomerase 2 family)